MKATETTFSKIIQIEGNLEHYHVPKYQREYVWGKWQWDKLLLDIEENEPGHYMGSLICVDDGDERGPGAERIFEVVDGQQRLTTLSLLLMAIYKSLQDKEDEIEDDAEVQDQYRSTLSSLRAKILKKKKDYYAGESGGFLNSKAMCFLRVQPSTQHYNLEDYKYILSEIGLLRDIARLPHCTRRIIYKAYSYFKDRIPDRIEEIYGLIDKVNQLSFIHISVTSQANAFTLFETLNNRGVPLSAIDIIKNKLLAEMEKQIGEEVSDSYDKWQRIINNLPDASDQERFLRHYYNSFSITDKEIKIDKFFKATKSTLIGIYETLIKKDANKIFEELIAKSVLYNKLIEPEKSDDNNLRDDLVELNRIGAAPSYLLLLYLFSLDEQGLLREKDLIKTTIKLLQKYYVRRNITDVPSTRDLDSINSDIINKCQNRITKGGEVTARFIEDTLLQGKGKPASVPDFKAGLEDNLFYFNAGMARYLLANLDSVLHSREYRPDLWARNEKGNFIWTVEHIFPQGSNIPSCWVEMIGNGNREEAERILDDYAHCLGNLTLSGYNSRLSNSAFEEKQLKHEDKVFFGQKINIGYKNGLALNNIEFEYKGKTVTLANINEWTEEAIIARNGKMVEMLVDLYKFDGEVF